MTNPRISALVAALLACTLAFAAPILAGPPGGGQRCAGGFGPAALGLTPVSVKQIEHMADRLQLTKEQLQGIHAISDEARPQQRALRQRLVATGKQMQALLAQPGPDAAQVRALADTQGATIADLIVLRAKVQSDIQRVLTEEQRQRLQDAGKGKGAAPAPSEEGPAPPPAGRS